MVQSVLEPNPPISFSSMSLSRETIAFNQVH